MASFPNPSVFRHNADDLFQLLFNSVEAQNSKLAHLENESRKFARTDRLAELSEMLARENVALRERLAAVERDVAVDGGLAVGTAVVRNRAALRSVADEVSRKAEGRAVADRLKELEEAQEAGASEMKRWAASADTAVALEHTCSALADQCAHLERSLEQRLSRADAAVLLAAAERLRGFDAFMTQTEERMSDLERLVRAQGSEIEDLNAQNEALRSGVGGILAALEDTLRGQELGQMRERVRALEEGMLSRVPRTEYESTAERVESLRGASERLREGLQKAMGTVRLQGEALHELDERKATREEVDDARDAAREADNAIQGALSRGLSDRATHGDVADLRGALERLDGRVQETTRAANVAVKFVEWFSARGSAYEHNIGAIDRHLEKLVLSSARPSPEGGAPASDNFTPFANALHVSGL